MDDSVVIVGEVAVENGLFLDDECKAVAAALVGGEITPDAVSAAAERLRAEAVVLR